MSGARGWNWVGREGGREGGREDLGRVTLAGAGSKRWENTGTGGNDVSGRRLMWRMST